MSDLSVKSLRLIILLLLFAVVPSCQEEKPKSPDTSHERELKESMIKANKSLTRSEEEGIEAFISRYAWSMEKTGTGLRYMIYHHTQGEMARKGDKIKLNYSLMLLNGSPLYSSKDNGPMEFELGKGKMITGLEEGIFLLRLGERAKFIIPSHLAFGLLGDQGKIPPKATLVYDVELTSMNRQ